MDFEYVDTPFPHIIINNVLPEDIYKEQMDAFQKYSGSRWTVFEHRFGEKIKEKLFNEFIDNCFKEQLLTICKEMLVMRNEQAKEKREKVQIDHNKMRWIDSMRCEDRVGYKIRIHPDIEQKIISVVIYMNGKGPGTTLWNREHTKSYEITPKPNTALVFVPMQGISYHSVAENDVNDRHTIQLTLRRV